MYIDWKCYFLKSDHFHYEVQEKNQSADSTLILLKIVKMFRCACVLRSSASRLLSLAAGVRHKHTLPKLPYGYSALEPVVSSEIMELHHSKHHATYVNNLNAAEETLGQHVEQGIMYWVTVFQLYFAAKKTRIACTYVRTMLQSVLTSSNFVHCKGFLYVKHSSNTVCQSVCLYHSLSAFVPFRQCVWDDSCTGCCQVQWRRTLESLHILV